MSNGNIGPNGSHGTGPAADGGEDPSAVVDPFDLGDVQAGIQAHLAAGESVNDIIEYLAADRLSLRTQNDQMWKIIEKQRAIVHQLQGQVAESLEEENNIRAAVSAASQREEQLNRDIQERSENFTRLEQEHRRLLQSSNERIQALQRQVQDLQEVVQQQQHQLQSKPHQPQAQSPPKPQQQQQQYQESTLSQYGGRPSTEWDQPREELQQPPLSRSQSKSGPAPGPVGPHRQEITGTSPLMNLPLHLIAQQSNFQPQSSAHPAPSSASSGSNLAVSVAPSPQLQDFYQSSTPPNATTPQPATIVHQQPGPQFPQDGPLPPIPTQQLQQMQQIQQFPNQASPNGAMQFANIPVGPAALPRISSTIGSQVNVIATTPHNKDMVSFTIIVRLATGESWKIEKLFGDVVLLDSKLRSSLSRQQLAKIGKLPDKALIFSLNPAKSDQKKMVVELFLQKILDVVYDSPDVVEFLTVGAVADKPVPARGGMTGPADGAAPSRYAKEGYLVKKGKSFGGWKSRYFKLRRSSLEYYETATSRELLGVIELQHCLVFRGHPGGETKNEHSLTLIEYRPGSFPPPPPPNPSGMALPEPIPQDSRIVNRHTFSAETDAERDEWVRLLATHIVELRPGFALPAVLTAAVQGNPPFAQQPGLMPPQGGDGFAPGQGPWNAPPYAMSPPQQPQGLSGLTPQQQFQQQFMQQQQLQQNQQLPPQQQPQQFMPSQPLNQPMHPVGSPGNAGPMQAASMPAGQGQQPHELSSAYLAQLRGMRSGSFSVLQQKQQMQQQQQLQQQQQILQQQQQMQQQQMHQQQQLQPPHQMRQPPLNGNFGSTGSPNGGFEQMGSGMGGAGAVGNTSRSNSPTGNFSTNPGDPPPIPSTQGLPPGLPRGLPPGLPAAPASSPSAPAPLPAPRREPTGFVDDNARIMEQNPPPLPPLDQGGWGQGMQNKKGASAKKPAAFAPWGKKKPSESSHIKPDPSRVVFGIPLDQAVEISRLNDYSELPAVVYRCIEYLEARNAKDEEGIYRLSGSNSTIQGLKERFNVEGDVDLLGSGEPYDVHAIAGLLKLYLRELPSTVLTKNHQRDFLKITEITDRDDRITELSRQVSALPLPNYTLLSCLIGHLIRIVQCADRNKMSVRNVGIVFSPTLGVPANIMTLMLAEYELVFCWDDPVKAKAAKEREREMLERRAAAEKQQQQQQSQENGEDDARKARRARREAAGMSIVGGAGGGAGGALMFQGQHFNVPFGSSVPEEEDGDSNDLYDLGDYT